MKSLKKFAAGSLAACLLTVAAGAQERLDKPAKPAPPETRTLKYAFESNLALDLESLALEGMEFSLEGLDLRLLEFSEESFGLGPAFAMGESFSWSLQESSGSGRSRSQASREKREAERALRRAQRDRDRASRRYASGKKALDRANWERAIERFNDVIEGGGEKTDGALYWLAYAQYRAGNADEAMASLQRLESGYPDSRWRNDAAALKAEIQQGGGTTPSAEGAANEEMKEAALIGLMHVEDERAVPVLERFLQGTNSPRLKERALFVLAQMDSPRAAGIMAEVARGSGNPDLQAKAIQYLGIHGREENRKLLAEIYSSSNDTDVRRRILRSFMLANDKERLLQVARQESDEKLRGEAAKQLGIIHATAELRELYGSETSAAVKKQLLQGMFLAGDAEGLMQVARSETDEALQLRAVRNLGLCNNEQARPFLAELYEPGRSVAVRKEVLKAMFLAGDAEGLVEIARKEADPDLKKRAVKHLSLMNSKAATDYLLEVLEQ